MSEDTKQMLIKRAKSFLWRLGVYAAVAVVGFVSQNLELFQLNPQVLFVIALGLGEVTKFLNNLSQQTQDRG